MLAPPGYAKTTSTPWLTRHCTRMSAPDCGNGLVSAIGRSLLRVLSDCFPWSACGLAATRKAASARRKALDPGPLAGRRAALPDRRHQVTCVTDDGVELGPADAQLVLAVGVAG